MWEACSLDALWEMIADAELAMDKSQLRLWGLIRIQPVKWQLPPWGDQGGGFWIVATLGRNVIWYNDIEEGFNLSPYTTEGIIGEYWCNQDELVYTVGRLIN